jgi:hypothetical protein
MNDDQILRLLSRSIREAGSLRKWAAAHDISPSYVSSVRLGRNPPADKILRELGLERRVTETVQRRRA